VTRSAINSLRRLIPRELVLPLGRPVETARRVWNADRVTDRAAFIDPLV